MVPDILDITPTTKEEVRQQLRALYEEEPSEQAVNNYWRDLQSSGPRAPAKKQPANKAHPGWGKGDFFVLPNGQ